MKRLISVLLCVCILTGSALAIAPVRDDKGFEDAELHWARDYIAVCWQTGLMEGMSDTEFGTEGTLTVAQCATVAARLHTNINSLDEISAGSPWYAPYTEYLQELGYTLPENLNAACTRVQFIEMMALVVPNKMLEPINEINTLPDTKDEAILRFYEAGILTGMDEYGTFRGALNLTRAECATMIARIAQEDLRLKFKPTRSDGSAAMQVLYTPADTTAITIGDYDVRADLFTAVLTCEMEQIAAEYQLIENPDYLIYYEMWLGSGYSVGFERFLSEMCGINEFSEVDWSAIDENSGTRWSVLAYERTMEALREHAAIRTLAQKRDVTVTDQQRSTITKYIENAKVEGESRMLYNTAALENYYLYDAVARKLCPSETEVMSKLASGEYLCAEFIGFEKTNILGEALTDVEIALLRDGAKLFAAELSEQPNHFILRIMARELEGAYIEPRCTLWSKDETEKKLWDMLKGLEPIGVSEALEDEDGFYVYLVSNPLADDALLDAVCLNVGEDRVNEQIEISIKNAAVKYSDAVKYLVVADAAARVLRSDG